MPRGHLFNPLRILSVEPRKEGYERTSSGQVPRRDAMKRSGHKTRMQTMIAHLFPSDQQEKHCHCGERLAISRRGVDVSVRNEHVFAHLLGGIRRKEWVQCRTPRHVFAYLSHRGTHSLLGRRLRRTSQNFGVLLVERAHLKMRK